MKDLESTKFVIWDWNGTLCNDAALAHRVFVTMQQRRGMAQTSFDQFQRFYDHPIELLYRRAGFDLERESYSSLADEWHQNYEGALDSNLLHDDTATILDYFKTMGVRQSILSAAPHDPLLEAVSRQGIGDYFDFIQGLGDRFCRSKIEKGAELMKSWRAVPEQTILIGDSTHDFETAGALGVECFLVARGLEHREKLVRHSVTVLDNFSSLVSLLSVR